MKNTLLSLSIVLMAITTLVACDSKEEIALAVETQTIAKTMPVETGACTIGSISYDRDENVISLSVTINPVFPETAIFKPIEKADAMKEMDILLRTSELTKLLVAMVNAKAVLHLDVTCAISSTVDFYYTLEQLKDLCDAPQLTVNEYAAQSMAVSFTILNKSCPIPCMYNTMTLEKASETDSVITYEIMPRGGVVWNFKEIAAHNTEFQQELLDYITEGYNRNPGWRALIKAAWALERTLCFKVKDPASSRTITFDFPARASLYWIINPK